MATDPLQSQCGCGAVSTQQVCGNFTAPVNPDQGRACPPPVKIDSEAPTLPSIRTVVYNPDVTDPDVDPLFTLP